MGGWIALGIAKYTPERLNSLVIGGAHPYEQKLPPSSQLDGADPDAFLASLRTTRDRYDHDSASRPTGSPRE